MIEQTQLVQDLVLPNTSQEEVSNSHLVPTVRNWYAVDLGRHIPSGVAIIESFGQRWIGMT